MGPVVPVATSPILRTVSVNCVLIETCPEVNTVFPCCTETLAEIFSLGINILYPSASCSVDVSVVTFAPDRFDEVYVPKRVAGSVVVAGVANDTANCTPDVAPVNITGMSELTYCETSIVSPPKEFSSFT